jgi:uncharacterized protein
MTPPPTSESGERGAARLRRLGTLIVRIPSWVLIGMVTVYRWTLSPVLGRQCRFEPTCSVYFIQSVRKYGAVRGAFRGVMRICRCHPWHPGGFDPP